jgi:2-dehydropantoate 2-reductase
MVYNAAVNPIGTLTRKTNGQLASEPALRELVCSVVREAAAIARAAGFPPLDIQPTKRVLQGCRAAPNQINSMSQDIEAGRKTEADAILKPLLLSARRTKRSTRYIEPLYRMIRGLEKLTA